MAKVISYKFLSCEIEHEIIVEVPLLDEDGNPVVNEIKTPVTEEVTIPVLNEMGEPLLDEEGQPIAKVITQPAYDENGEPVYDITYESVMTMETRVEVEQVILDKSIICPTQATYDANYSIAEKEAVGEITVEGEFDPEPSSDSDLITWNELDMAYTDGINSL